MNPNEQQTEEGIDETLRLVECDLNRHGILYLTRAQYLLSAVKSAKLRMIECETRTPTDFFSAKWHEQHKALCEVEERLQRIMNVCTQSQRCPLPFQ